ncbi:MAG: phosphatase PAP2 family protein [Gemmatimonadales bacterium]
MTPRIRPADWLIAGYNAVLALLWSQLWDQAWYAPWICAAHSAAALLPALFARSSTARPGAGKPMAALRGAYPLVWLLSFWTELGLLHPLGGSAGNDPLVAGLDLALFGDHLNLIWMPAMPQLWFSELMHLIYFAYYPLIFLPPILMGISGRSEALTDITFRLMVTYLGCYLFYLAFPVIGPATLMPSYDGPLTQGFFYQLTHHARDAGDSLGTAFPSSHVAGSVTIAIVAWIWLSPRIAGVVTAEAMGVVFATVYTQNHYAIDALAGIVWAVLLQVAVVPVLLWLLSPAQVEAPVPILPGLMGPSWPEPATTGGGS